MENIFETLGGILRPENSNKEFAIVETVAEHCLGYNRATGGRTIVSRVTATSADQALENWLTDKSDVYSISRIDEGFCKDSSRGWIVWQEGDTFADFGYYTVSAETE